MNENIDSRWQPPPYWIIPKVGYWATSTLASV